MKYDLTRYILPASIASVIAASSLVPVFGRGLLDLFDEVFWMLPFSSARQSVRVRQDNNITEEVWNARCKAIRDLDEHRLSNARAELERLWKERIAKNNEKKETGAVAEEEVDDAAIPMDD